MSSTYQTGIKPYLPIGFTFTLDDMIIRVEKSELCNGCVAWVHDKYNCEDFNCTAEGRGDNTSVVFKVIDD